MRGRCPLRADRRRRWPVRPVSTQQSPPPLAELTRSVPQRLARVPVAIGDRAASTAWASAAAFACWWIVGCHGVDVGEANPDVGFWGDHADTGDVPDDGGSSGLSECYLLDHESCGEGATCVPTADGLRRCVASANQVEGARCSTLVEGDCASGLLCVGHATGTLCRRVCDPERGDCGSEPCRLLMVVDGERIGLCGQ